MKSPTKRRSKAEIKTILKIPLSQSPAEASQPSSPDRQLRHIAMEKNKGSITYVQGVEQAPSEEDLDRYYHYIEENAPRGQQQQQQVQQQQQLGKLLRPEWQQDLLLRKLLLRQLDEAWQERERAEGVAIVNYVLMDVEERRRVGIYRLPEQFKREKRERMTLC